MTREPDMKKILIDLQYLPSVAYFTALYQAEEVWIEGHEHFVKQTYRSRCRILGVHGVQDLNIPVHQHGGVKVPVQDITIDYKQKWANNHWRSIQSAYGKAPFFDYYADPIREVIQSQSNRLFELNWQLLTICLKCLGMNTELRQTRQFDTKPVGDIVDLRGKNTPKKHLDTYWHRDEPYYQIFGNNFVPNLTIIDLLFNEGPMAPVLLQKSVVR